MASISGKEGNANMAPYSVSKAGVICFTKSLAKEVLADGIRVNCVAPALIDTPILREMEPERVDFLTSKIPLGRLGRPEEGGGDDSLPRLRRVDLRHRGLLRRQRRQGDLLMASEAGCPPS